MRIACTVQGSQQPDARILTLPALWVCAAFSRTKAWTGNGQAEQHALLAMTGYSGHGQ